MNNPISATPPAHDTVDIGIITIKEEELEAVLDRLPRDPQVIIGSRSRRSYNIFDFKNDLGSTYRLAVLRCSEQGNGEAQEATRDLLEDLSPKWILVVGIAGGSPSEDFTLGDVIVSNRIYDFSVEAALSDGGHEYAVAGGGLDRSASGFVANLKAIARRFAEWNSLESIRQSTPPVDLNKLSLYGDFEWQAKVKSAVLPLVKTPTRLPQFKTGGIASSDRLVKNTDILRIWRKVARGAMAIEMESAGVYRAAHDRVSMFSIRGISDIVGLERSAVWTAYACQTAAAFMHALLRSGSLPITRLTTSATEQSSTEPAISAQSLQQLPPPVRAPNKSKV
jgi:nucleoside phosphorylase